MVKVAAFVAGVAAFAVLLAAPFGAARADTLDFSYTFASGDVLAGVLSGADAGNYFTVSAVQSLTLNGHDASNSIAGATPQSYDTLEGRGAGYNGDGTGVVTLDGSYLDLVVTANQISGFGFAVNDAFSGVVGSPYIVFAGIRPDPSEIDFQFVPANWSAELVPAPEPGSLAVLAGALGVFALTRRAARG
jgi:hypothetical protein